MLMSEQLPKDRILPTAALESVLAQIATDPYGHIEEFEPEIAQAAHVRSIANIAADVRRVRELQRSEKQQTPRQ